MKALTERTGGKLSSGAPFTRGETQVNRHRNPPPFAQQGGPHMPVASEEPALHLFKVENSEA